MSDRLSLGMLFVASLLLAPLASVGASGPNDNARDFLAETGRAMATMDSRMMAKPTGNVDHDFVAMMVPHHQGAIDMAVAELRHGHDERLKRIAQEIIVDQQQEIAAMRLALDQALPPSRPAPTQILRISPEQAGTPAG